MRLQSLFLAVTSALWATTSASPIKKRDFGPITVFTPPDYYSNERTLYARSLLLKDGTILSTWENYDWTIEPYFPIYQSKDHGYSWNEIAKVNDTQNNWGLRYQPVLYLLEQPLGDYPAGTILLAGNSIPADLSKTQLDLYASRDDGYSWEFVSHIASGGEARPNNGLTPVWEPFLMVYQDKLICYYSDQRDPAYGQKLVHQTTCDLKNWDDIVNDVTDPEYARRPGMPIVSQMSNGDYFYSYEDGGSPDGNFAVTYKISSDPLAFGSVDGTTLKTADGYVPLGSPFNIFTPVGGDKGTLVVSGSTDSDLFVNHNLGQGSWDRLTTQDLAGYSRSLAVGFNPKDVLIVNGGRLGQGENNTVTASARDVNGCDSCT